MVGESQLLLSWLADPASAKPRAPRRLRRGALVFVGLADVHMDADEPKDQKDQGDA